MIQEKPLPGALQALLVFQRAEHLERLSAEIERVRTMDPFAYAERYQIELVDGPARRVSEAFTGSSGSISIAPLVDKGPGWWRVYSSRRETDVEWSQLVRYLRDAGILPSENETT